MIVRHGSNLHTAAESHGKSDLLTGDSGTTLRARAAIGQQSGGDRIFS